MTKHEMATELAKRRYPCQPFTRLDEYNRLMRLSKSRLQATYGLRTNA